MTLYWAFSRLPMLALNLTLAWSRGSQRPLQVPLQGAPDPDVERHPRSSYVF
jgi:hypothetical protein